MSGRPLVRPASGAALLLAVVACRVAEAPSPAREPDPVADAELEAFRGLGLALLPRVPMPDRHAASRVEALSARAASFDEVMLALFSGSELNLLVDGDVRGTASLDIKNAALEDAFEAVLESFDLASEWDGTFLRIRDRERRVFDVDYPAGGLTSSSIGENGQGEGGGDAAQSTVTRFWDALEEDLAALVDDTASRLVVNRNLGSVMVEARPSTVRRVEEYLDDVRRRATRQVSIEAHVFEVQLRQEFRAGVDFSLLPDFLGLDAERWSGIGQSGGAISQLGRAGADVFQAGLLKTGQFALFVDALEQQGQVRVISSPRVSTLHNVPAQIRVVEQVPVIERQIVDSQLGTRTEFSVRFEDAGVVVAVTPFIGEDGVITAEIQPSITEVSGFVSTPDGLVTEPILNTRTVHTVLRVPDGRPIVLGGLRGQDVSDEVSKTPLLGDVPGIGPLFRKTVQTTKDTELIVVLFPRILTPIWERADYERGLDRVVDLQRDLSWSPLDVPDPDRGFGRFHLEGPPAVPGAAAATAIADGGAATGGGLTREALAVLALRRAMVALDKGQRTQGRTELGVALELAPDLAPAWIVRAVLELKSGDRSAARRSLERALQLAPDDPVARNDLALLELHDGNAIAAEALLEPISGSMSPFVLNNLGLARLAQGRVAEASATFALASRRAPGLPEPYLNRAVCLDRLGRTEDARDAYRGFLRAGGRVGDPRVGPLADRITEIGAGGP